MPLHFPSRELLSHTLLHNNIKIQTFSLHASRHVLFDEICTELIRANNPFDSCISFFNYTVFVCRRSSFFFFFSFRFLILIYAARTKLP